MIGEGELSFNSVGSHSSRLFVEAGSEGQTYRGGYVVTPHGVVGIYAQEDYTILVFAHGDRQVSTYLAKQFTERRLITECRRFAERADVSHTQKDRP